MRPTTAGAAVMTSAALLSSTAFAQAAAQGTASFRWFWILLVVVLVLLLGWGFAKGGRGAARPPR